jgi:hypothetical protein
VLYECLAGRPPFQAESPVDTLMQVLEKEPAPPSALRPGLPCDLETVFLRSLRKEPARRYDSALDLAEDLERFLAGDSIHARRGSRAGRAWRWCRRNPAQVALLTMMAALVLVLGVGVPVKVFVRHERDQALASLARAEAAERGMQIRAHLARAVASRRSGQRGQRFRSLAELKAAMQLNPSPMLRGEMRDEALACLVLADLETVREWDGCPVTRTAS